MRQRLDPTFFYLLCRIRLGIPNQEDINQLELRLINKAIKEITSTETAKFYKSLDKNVSQSVSEVGNRYFFKNDYEYN
jgi:hypothetical protein